ESLLPSDLSTSWPASCRPSTSCSALGEKGVDGRVKPVKPGHDAERPRRAPERPLAQHTQSEDSIAARDVIARPPPAARGGAALARDAVGLLALRTLLALVLAFSVVCRAGALAVATCNSGAGSASGGSANSTRLTSRFGTVQV